MNVAEHGLGRSGADADDGEIDGLLARLRAGREPDAETVDDDAPVFVPSTLGTEPQALPSRPHATLTDENATRRLELPHRHAAPAHDEPTATGGHTLTFAGPGFGAAETHPYAPTATSDEPTRILRPAAQAPGQETTQIVRQPLHAEPAVYAAPSEHIGRHAAPDPEEATRALSRSAIAGALGHRDSDHLGSGEDARVILPGDSHPITIPAIYRDHGETTVRIPVAEQSAWPPLNNAQGEGGPGQKTVNLDAHRPVRLGETPHEGPTIPVTDALLAGLGAAGQRTGLVDEGKTVRFTLPDSAAQPMPREMPRNFPPRQ